MASTIDGDLQVRGTLRAASAVLPSECVGNDAVDPGDPLGVDKVDHRHTGALSQVHGSAATAERRVIRVAEEAGTVTGARAGVVVACIGAAVITVDIRKNGTTILTGTNQVDSGDVAYAKVDLALDGALDDYVAGDVFEAVVTVAAGGGTLGQGLFVEVSFNEGAG